MCLSLMVSCASSHVSRGPTIQDDAHILGGWERITDVRNLAQLPNAADEVTLNTYPSGRVEIAWISFACQDSPTLTTRIGSDGKAEIHLWRGSLPGSCEAAGLIWGYSFQLNDSALASSIHIVDHGN